MSPLFLMCILIFSLPISFTIDLNRGNDIAFHLNPRFNEAGRQVIVRNSCIGTQWGKEERELASFPFVQGKPFEVSMARYNFVSFSSRGFYLDKNVLNIYCQALIVFKDIRECLRYQITGCQCVKAEKEVLK